MTRFRHRLLAAVTALALTSGAALGQNAFPPVGTMFSTTLAGTVASAAKVLSGISGKSIYITNMIFSPAATAVVTVTAGTGTNCATGTTTPITMTFATGQPVNFGDGDGTIIVIPQGNDVCIATATATAPGSIGWARF